MSRIPRMPMPVRVYLVICLVLCSICPHILYASEIIVIPEVELRTTYDDNLFFDDVSDFELLATPRLTYRTMWPTAHVQLTAEADVYQYVEENQYDRVNQNYGLDARKDLSPTLSSSFQGHFAVDHTFENELEETGIETDKNRRFLMSARPSLTWDIGPRHSLRMSLGWNRVDYRQSSSVDNPDYDRFGLSATLFREWTQRLSLVGQVDVSLTTIEDQISKATDFSGNTFDLGRKDHMQYSYQALVGAEYELAQTLDLSFRGGAGLTRIEYTEAALQFSGPLELEPQTKDVSEDSFVFLFSTSLDWEQELYRIGLQGSRNITQSPDGDTINRTRFQLNAEYDLTENLVLLGRGSFVYSRSVDGDDDEFDSEVNSQSYAVSPGLRYVFSPKLSLAGRYEFRVIEDRDDDDREKRHRAWLELTYRWPMVF